MIVNSPGDTNQMMDTHNGQNDNYFLKRKLTLDMLDPNQSYVQPKKRIIQNFSNNFVDQCNESFNFNGDVFSDCNGIELINFDGVTLVPPIQTATVFTAAVGNDGFDTSWTNADLLELDQRYNTVVNLNSDCQGMERVSSTSMQDEPEMHVNTQPVATETLNQEQDQNDMDFDDRNLSWLFNFKLDELPHLSPEVNRTGQLSPTSKQSTDPAKMQQQMRTGRKVDELIMETTADFDENEMNVAENIVVDTTPKVPKKPPFTYTELIEYALEDKGELTVSGIYQWISDRFPFYKSNDDRWKNSVRHNLSINPHFRKGVKATQGAGHLWTIASRDSEEHALAWQHKKQRLELFFKMEQSSQRKVPVENQSFDETATAVANITQQLQSEPSSVEVVQSINSSNNGQCTEPPLSIGLMSRKNDLERTAGEILNGIRRDVEVQSINSTIVTYQDSLLEGEYLNPGIDRDHLYIDNNLRLNHHHNQQNELDSAFYVTEIDPVELGINMSNVEEEVLFSDEFNLNYFGITSANDIVA